jgi:hypothetical protein
VIPFSNKDKAGVYRDRCALDAEEVAAILPLLSDALAVDSYVAVNGMAVSGKRSVYVEDVGPLLFPKRKGRYADYLCAAFLDFDCYTAGISKEEAMDRLDYAQSTGLLPPITMYHDSGRGIWAFWYFGDERGRVPKTGGTERRMWVGIERELVNRVQFLDIGVDAGAIDLARVFRIPGSQNSKADNAIVRALCAKGRRPYYTVKGLHDFLGVKSWIPREIPTGNHGTGRGVAGHRALCNGRVELVEALARLRGGTWHEGTRNRGIFLTVCFMLHAGYSDERIRETAERARLECGLPYEEAAGIVKDLARIRVYRKWSDAKIRDWLAVTEKEAHTLGWYGPSRDYSPEVREAGSIRRAAYLEKVRGLLRDFATESGGTIPSGPAAKAFLASRGVALSVVSILKHVKAVGIKIGTVPGGQFLPGMEPINLLHTEGGSPLPPSV